MSPSDASAKPPENDAEQLEQAAQAVFLAMERIMSDGTSAGVSDRAVQQIITAGARLFAAKIDQEQRTFLPIVAPHAITATEAAVLSTELLPAVDLNLFDLSAWASRPRDG
ncbi:MAG: hypothetical protein JXQ99_00660 [Hyphomicrobiaceae bacterium]